MIRASQTRDPLSNKAIRSFAFFPLIILTGCNTILTPHSLSQDKNGEVITVELLSYKDVAQTYRSEWEKAFGKTFPAEDSKEALPAVLAPMAVSLGESVAKSGVEFVSKQLAEEAERYEAEFKGEALVDNFWKKVKPKGKGPATWVPNFYGVEIKRETNKFNGDKPAFDLVLGFSPTVEGNQFLVAPLVLRVHSSKAKVLDMQPWAYFIPPFIWPIFFDSNDDVKNSIEGEITSTWTIKDEYKADALAKFNADLPNTQLKSNGVKLSSTGNTIETKLPRGVITTFRNPPRSDTAKDEVMEGGVLKIALRVKQRDSSNAREYVTKGVTYISEQKDKVGEAVKKLIEEADQDEEAKK